MHMEIMVVPYQRTTEVAEPEESDWRVFQFESLAVWLALDQILYNKWESCSQTPFSKAVLMMQAAIKFAPMRYSIRKIQVLFAALYLILTASAQTNEQAQPQVIIKSVPTDMPGTSWAAEPVVGIASGVNFKDVKVVVYAYGGDKWYVQPTTDSPNITINEDGKWEVETHGGLEFAALLVKTSFQPRATLRMIPQAGGDVLAVAKKKPEKSGNK